MKVPTKVVMDAFPVLMKINTLSGLPAPVAYRFMQQMRLVAPIAQAFHMKHRELAEKYGEKQEPDEQGNVAFKLQGDNKAAFEKEVDIMLSEDVEVLDPIEWPVENTSLSPAELEAVDSFITINDFGSIVQVGSMRRKNVGRA